MLPSLKGAVGTTLSTVFAGSAAHRGLKEATVMITAAAPSAVAKETLKLRDTISLRFLFIEENSLPFSFLRESGRRDYRNWVRLSDPFFGNRRDYQRQDQNFERENSNGAARFNYVRDGTH